MVHDLHPGGTRTKARARVRVRVRVLGFKIRTWNILSLGVGLSRPRLRQTPRLDAWTYPGLVSVCAIA